MVKERVERVASTSADFVAEQVERLRVIFPEIVTEGRVDFDRLRATLGSFVDDRPERYSFTWAGKQQAIRALQSPTWGTLKPDHEASTDFDSTKNIFIEGENLEVLKLLYKSYFGRVKMIYIDPPYNTGNDFVYSDDFRSPKDVYLRMTGQLDETGNLLTSNPETSGRYHSDWLSMMYPRLFLARQFLRDDGVIFVSIDDHEAHNLRLLMNEVFGEENFITCVIWQKVYSPKNTARHFSEDHDYVLIYARNGELWQPRLLPRTEEMEGRYRNPDNDPRGPWKPGGLDARNYYSEGTYPITTPSGRLIPRPPSGSYWRVSWERLQELDRDNRIWWGEDGSNVPAIKRFLSEVRQGRVPQTIWPYSEVGHTQEAKKELLEYVHFEHTENVINTVKPTRLIQRMLQIATESEAGDIVLDFFAGSAATAHAVLKQNREDSGNRRFICVQLPEPLPTPEPGLTTIADIGTQRIRRAGDEFRREREGKFDFQDRETPEDLGFALFSLIDSNWRHWQELPAGTDPAEYARALELFHDPLVGAWQPEDVMYEVMLREGLSLTSRVERVENLPSDVNVWRVTDDDKDQSLLICLDARFELETARELNLTKDDLFICRDVALDDTEAANLALQCRLKII